MSHAAVVIRNASFDSESPTTGNGGEDRAGNSQFKWVLACGLLFQLAVITYFYLQMDTAIGRLMPDDAFYYLNIARNIRLGHGSAFSPGEPTNGYHPLWMAILVIIQFLFNPSAKPFVGCTMLLAVSCNAAAALALRSLLTQVGASARQVALGALLYLLSPWTVNLTLTGLETPLFFACFFAFLQVVASIVKQPAVLRQQWIRLGVAAGLLMLARTDTVFFTLPAFAYLFWIGRAAALKPLLGSGVLASLLLAPWLIWSQLTFGSIVQCSGVAMAALTHSQMPPPPSVGYFRAAFYNWHYSLYRLFFAPFLHPKDYGRPDDFWRWVNIAMLVGLCIPILRNVLRGSTRVMSLFAWYLPCLLLCIFYFGVRIYVQVWHLAPVLGVAVLALSQTSRLQFLSSRMLVVSAVCLIGITSFTLTSCYFYPQQKAGLPGVAMHFLPDAPEPMRIGATDCGYMGYFSKHTFVNLDGVVNNRAFRSIMDGRFSDYVATQHFDSLWVEKERYVFYDRNLPGGGPGRRAAN